MRGLGLKELFKNVLFVITRQIGSGLLQVITLILIARTYGPDGNGVYMIALLLPTTLVTLLSFGAAPANVYYLSGGRVNTLVAWRSILKIFVGGSVIGVVLGAMVIIFFSGKWFPEIPSLLLWISLPIFPVSLLLSFVFSFFQGLQQFDKFNYVLLLHPLLVLLTVVLVILSNLYEVKWLIVAYLVSSIITLLFAFYKLKPFLNNGNPFGFTDYDRTILSYGCKVHLSNILSFVNYKADIFLVNFYIGPVGVGIYLVAVQLSERLWLLSHAVGTVLLPRISQLYNDEDKRKAITPLVTRWVLMITFLSAVFLSIIAYPIISIVFGEVFVSAYYPFLFLLPGIVAGSASRVIANDIAARGRPELNFYSSCLVVFINVLGNFLLIPKYGISGAAIATTIAYIINFLLRLFTHHYLTKVPVLNNILINKNDIKLLKSWVLNKL
ncbi:flippase [Zobellella endophytica]|uniref:flippase n=1 Tax=Zobellella endophytica TaxID=2116700 RepID=UPI001304829A|nr:flippase [Zobellella endophytica]